MTTRLLAEIK